MSVPSSVAATFLVLPPSLTITSAHTDPFTQGQSNATYTLTVANAANAGPTGGTVTVMETPGSGLIPVGLSGSGWTCTGTSCTRSDSLPTGAAYPPITVTANVAINAPASTANAATVSGGGSFNASVSDPTNITALPVYSNPLAFAVPASVVGGVYSTLSVTYASRNGASDIASGQVQIDGCSLEWDSTGNLSLSGAATGVLGTQGAKVSNGSCAIDLGNSSLAPVPNNPDAVRLSLSMAFKEQSMVGNHEVYAWGTSAEHVTTSQVDLGALVVSQGQDFILNVTPGAGQVMVAGNSSTVFTIGVSGLNGFSGTVALTTKLDSSPCFTYIAPSSITANTSETITIQASNCPMGAYADVEVSGSALGITRIGSNLAAVTVSTTPSFSITAGVPNVPWLDALGTQQQFPFTLRSANGLSGSVTFTVTGLPPGVTAITPTVPLGANQTVPFSVYFTGSASMPGGSNALTIIGWMNGNALAAAQFSLGTQVTTFTVNSVTGSGIVHNNGQQVSITNNVTSNNTVPSAATTCAAPAGSAITCTASPSGGTLILSLTAPPGTAGNYPVNITDSTKTGGMVVNAFIADGGGGGTLPTLEVTSGVDHPPFHITLPWLTWCGGVDELVPCPVEVYGDIVSGGGDGTDVTIWVNSTDPAPEPGDYAYYVNDCEEFADPEDGGCVFDGDVHVEPSPTCSAMSSAGGMSASVRRASPRDACPPAGPTITNIAPNNIYIGSQNVTINITGSGLKPTGASAPTFTLPSGATYTAGRFFYSPDGTGLTLFGVSVSYAAAIGNGAISVTVDGVTSNQANLIINGPDHVKVLNDGQGNVTGVLGRITNYQVMNFDNTPLSSSILIAESFAASGWNCNERQPAYITAACDGSKFTTNDGKFTDTWSQFVGYTPPGCGFNITDLWQWCAPDGKPGPQSPITFLKLTGFAHTDSTSINGVVNPPATIAPGTTIGKDGTTQPPQQ